MIPHTNAGINTVERAKCPASPESSGWAMLKYKIISADISDCTTTTAAIK